MSRFAVPYLHVTEDGTEPHISVMLAKDQEKAIDYTAFKLRKDFVRTYVFEREGDIGDPTEGDYYLIYGENTVEL